MEFFSPSAAVDFIRQRLRDFYAQRPLLLTQQQELRTLYQAAVKQGKPVAPITALEAEVYNSLQRHGNLERALAPIAKWLDVPTGQLGIAIPLAIVAVAIPVAGLLYLHFQKVRSHQQALDLISRGLLTPSEAATLAAQPVFTLGSFGVTPLLILGVLGAVFFLGGRR